MLICDRNTAKNISREDRVLCTYDDYVNKQKERFAELPISNILFTNRRST